MYQVIQSKSLSLRRQVFVSYSHQQQEWKDRIVASLDPLQRIGQIEEWHDGKLVPGQPWDDKIRTALRRSDIVLLLVSSAFLSSKYIFNKEIPPALERAKAGKTFLIPVILEACDWESQPFAKYQAFPLTGMPLFERPDIDAALKEFRENLALACIGEWYSRRPDAGSSRDQGHWRVTLLPAKDTLPDWKKIIHTVREFSKEPDIEFRAVQRQPSNECDTKEIVFVFFDGPRQTFSNLKRAHEELKLSAAMGIEVIAVDLVHGAAFRADMTEVEGASETVDQSIPLLIPSDHLEPPHLLGLAVRPSEPDWFLPLNTKAGSAITDDDWESEKKKLLDYFFTALMLHGKDIHVNLSVFEQDRIMPRALAQTPFGRLLVEQDCLLKHFTASLLHPDTPTGQEFWRRIREISHRYGNERHLELRQKVWLVAGSATIQEKGPGEPFVHPLPAGFEIRDSDWSAWISECRMRVLCDTDYLALQRNPGGTSEYAASSVKMHEDCLGVFREVVLPAIESEVNEGSHFAPLRQAYYGVTLAKWYREKLVQTGLHTRLAEIAEQKRLEWSGGEDPAVSSQEIGLDSEAPDWLSLYFQRYEDLLSGVFRCVRVEVDASTGQRIARVYFSGGVYFDIVSRVPRKK